MPAIFTKIDHNNGGDTINTSATESGILPEDLSLSASFLLGAIEVLHLSSASASASSDDPFGWDLFLRMASTMANGISKPAGATTGTFETPRAPGVPPPTPSKAPLLSSPTSPTSIKGQFIGAPADAQPERMGPKASTAASTLSGIGGGPGSISIGAHANSIGNLYGLQPPSAGLPSLVFPPTTQQAFHTRNLLLHIYSMFNGAQAAIHQLGANCEFNQNLITFLSNQLVEKDRKIQTLTASVNMLQTAVQRAMKNNDDLKKIEEGLHEEIKALRSTNSSEAGGKGQSMDTGKLMAKVNQLSIKLEVQAEEKATLIRNHDRKLGELEKEVGDLKENVDILEESLRYAVALRLQDGSLDIDLDLDFDQDRDAREQLRNDEDRAEKMLNGRLEDASAASDDSLIDEVNGITQGRENGNGGNRRMLFTDGASSSSGGYGLAGRSIYLDSIMEEPEEEDTDEFVATPAPFSQPTVPSPEIGFAMSACSGVTKLRATAKPFVGEVEYHYINNENTRGNLEEEGTALFL
ncbi:hypothetical protein DRE_04892 [Drechslerella stenobrocha 248]|uniref:Uncharacterized protein n=1 Tax=Drechslerella stenobrocha 248 TaxID=1043628 RepID=W7IA04_9PEZI|nr:hypothetical protein DRE_04892 [Drechslerella stenobrocha 248]